MLHESKKGCCPNTLIYDLKCIDNQRRLVTVSRPCNSRPRRSKVVGIPLYTIMWWMMGRVIKFVGHSKKGSLLYLHGQVIFSDSFIYLLVFIIF